MLNSQSAFRLFVFAAFVFFCEAVSPQDEYRARVDESADPAAIAKYANDIFVKSESITVRFVPRGNTYQYEIGMHGIDADWKYKYIVRCPVSCDRSVASLKLFLSSGIKLERSCPTPLRASIEFRKSGMTVAKLYVHASGSCFQFSGESVGYATDHEFQPVLEEFWQKF